MQEKFADGLQISVWSDCGGICAELFALKEIGQMLKTECGFNLTVLPYAYCDSDVQAREFTELNHQPVHVADNIFDRDFVTGTFNRIKCKRAPRYADKWR